MSKKLIRSMRIFVFAFLISFTANAQVERFQKLGIHLNAADEKKVQFWKSIYFEYSQKDYVLHSSKEVEHIYRVEHSEKEAFHQKKKLALLYPDDSIRIQRGQKDLLDQGEIISKPYLSRMAELLAEEGVPKELVRLPFVESAFNHEAKSKVGATGIWQFMTQTAMTDLRVSDSIDERYDPLKATRAAARFLKRNHDQFQNWGLAVMAYHQGPGLVREAIQKTGSHDPFQIIREFKNPQFQFASKNYLYEFLAMVDLDSKTEGILPPFITVSFDHPVKIQEITKHYQLKESELRLLNPHFRAPIWKGKVSIPAHYPLRLSGITLEEFRKLQYPKSI